MHINISTSAAVFRWRPGCWLRVTGEDAATFLQGQFTNDLRRLDELGAVYGLWLTLKGKVLADSFVLRGGAANEFWIGSYFSSAAVVRTRLEGHIIADDVTIEDRTGEWAAVSFMGEGAGVLMKENAPRDGSAFAFRGRRGEGENVEFIFPVATGEPAWVEKSKPTLRQFDAEAMERRRIGAGIPAIPADVGPGDLPNEAGLEVDAVSFTKGCYLGQEVMARLKSMGQVRRRLMRVRGDGGKLPARPAALFAGARQVGELRSAVSDGEGGWIGLAMLSLMHLRPGASLALVADAPPALRLVDSP